MLSSALMLWLAAGPCSETETETETVTLSLKANSSLQSVAASASKALCTTVTVDPAVAQKTITVTVTGTLPRRSARRIFEASITALGLELREEKGALVIAPPVEVTCDDVQRAMLLKSFRVVSDEERVVTREAFESDWVDCATNGARIVPAFREGAFMGLRLFAIRPDSLWAAAGFLNGDELISVNDLPLDSPEQTLTAYTKLRKSERLDFKLRRRDAPARLVITVEPKKP